MPLISQLSTRQSTRNTTEDRPWMLYARSYSSRSAIIHQQYILSKSRMLPCLAEVSFKFRLACRAPFTCCCCDPAPSFFYMNDIHCASFVSNCVDSVMTTAPKMVNGVRKLSLGIPSSEAGVSRSQCTLTVHQGSSLGQVSDAMTPASPTAGKSLGSCAVRIFSLQFKGGLIFAICPVETLVNL